MVEGPEGFDPDHIPGRLGIREADRQRLQEAARRFRQAATPSERLLWEALRGSRLGVKFRRQHPVGPLVVDFCCPRLRLVIEVDGPVHQQQAARDAARQRVLEDRGYRVLRLQAAEVEANCPAVVEQIAAITQELA